MASHGIYNLLIYVFVHTNDSFSAAKNFLVIHPVCFDEASNVELGIDEENEHLLSVGR